MGQEAGEDADMWCLSLTSPCCCGPCETRITTGAKVVFLTNMAVWILLLILSIIPLMSVHVALLCSFMAVLNLSGLFGLRKQTDFLPVPDTWRSKLRLRDRHQFCLLVPWILVHSFAAILWALFFVPVLVLASSKLYNYGHDPFTIGFLIIFLAIAVLLPYQLAVVVRCTRVVKKGGQHYVVPESSRLRSGSAVGEEAWAVSQHRGSLGRSGGDTASISTLSTQGSNSRV